MEEASATSVDEDFTPDQDPPNVAPPPKISLVAKVLARGGRPATVVEAPLVPIPPLDASTPTTEAPAAAVRDHPTGRMPAEPRPSDVSDVAFDALVTASHAEDDPDDDSGTRWCPRCGDRVAVRPNGRRCTSGHRLRATHRRRRLFGRG